MQQSDLERYQQRVQSLVGLGKIAEAMALANWVQGAWNQQNLRWLEEGMATEASGIPAIFMDSYATRFGESHQIVALSLSPGSATYREVLNLLRAQFVFTPDGTPEPTA